MSLPLPKKCRIVPAALGDSWSLLVAACRAARAKADVDVNDELLSMSAESATLLVQK